MNDKIVDELNREIDKVKIEIMEKQQELDLLIDRYAELTDED